MNWINTIKNYNTCNEQEAKDKEIILKCIEDSKNILTRENEVAHITSSGFIINKAKDKVLMIYHNIYNSWAWTGGHADGEEDLLKVAIREAQEETGIMKVVPLTDEIVSLDILTVVGHIKKGKYVAPHLHLSIAYLLIANEDESLKIKPDENSGVKWLPLDEIAQYSNEPYMVKVYEKIIKKIK
ncbi:NUDIX hydrolase [Candidatus Clostridium radicumherbarum]|uniref:NUDIX hydrolase n=1 Tax=Candidatus Clostridium radicumherbarum TaxID=3381662 RepID=A0ABW8TR47_9CLOT